MEKLELLIKHIQNLECEFVNRQEVLNRLTEINQALQLHKTQVSGSVFVIQNKYTMIIHGCFKTKKKAEGYINGNINYEVIKLSVY